MTYVMRYNNSPSHLSGLLPHNSSREGFTAPHHGQLNLGSGSSSSSLRINDVKVGLRHAIHSRRALSHNPIISSEDLAPKNIQFKLTPEEEEKRKIRREKNKVAASKCRTKKRDQISTTKKEYDQVTHSNNTMEREIERLKQERIKLQHTLNQHQCAIQTRGGSSSQRPGSSLQGNSRPGLSQNMRPASSAMRPPSSSGFMLQNQQNRENTRKDERSGENDRTNVKKVKLKMEEDVRLNLNLRF